MATGRKLGTSLFDKSDAFFDFLCAPCSDNGKNAEALFQCIDCQVLYCHKCVTGHNKYSKNHNIVDNKSKLFGQAQRYPKTFANSGLPTDLCEEHRGEVIKMFCGQHDMVCCTVCIAVKHRSCEGVYYIPNIAKDLLKRQDNYRTKTALEKVKDALQILKSKMQDDMKQLSNQLDSILEEIERVKKDLIRRVEELAKTSIKEVQEKHKSIFEGINACNKKIGHILEDVDKRLDKLKHSKNKTDAQTFVDIKKGESQIAVGNGCIKRSISRQVEALEFESCKTLKSCILEVHSLGALTVTRNVTTIDDELIALLECSQLGQRKASVLYDFAPQELGELLLKRGDEIIIGEEIDRNWNVGINIRTKRQGIFPVRYVKCGDTQLN